MTFTVTDALMSPLGMAVLTGAGLSEDNDVKHIHMTYDLALGATGEGVVTFKRLAAELGLPSTATIEVCDDTDLRPYATILDSNGAIVDWVDTVTLGGQASTVRQHIIDVDATHDLKVTAPTAANKTIKLDFYLRMTTGATEITISPDDFGGYFYVEADTLYRNQDGKDMAATITFPKVKIQSGFTIAMSPTGDPSQIRMGLAA
nr:MAG TPA: structural protein [Caudoviricetes sp.]